MKIAIYSEVPSAEADFIAEALKESGDVHQFCSWQSEAFAQRWDLAVGVGPVRAKPPAATSVLFVLGPTATHHDFGWNAVMLSSQGAYQNAARSWGQEKAYVVAKPPLLQLEAGRRRLLHPQTGWVMASSVFPVVQPEELRFFRVWNLGRGERYTALEYNSAVRAGCKGCYVGLADGYDLQVRRHFALGSGAVCDCDELVVGELAPKCTPCTPSIKPEDVACHTVEEPEHIGAAYRKEIKRLLTML